MSLHEFRDWQKFVTLEPLLSERVDVNGAMVASVIANVNRGKGQTAYTIQDFLVVQRMLDQTRKPEEADDIHMRATIISLGGAVA